MILAHKVVGSIPDCLNFPLVTALFFLVIDINTIWKGLAISLPRIMCLSGISYHGADDQTGWPNELSVRLMFCYIMGFAPWSSQNNDLKIDTYYFLARRGWGDSSVGWSR